MTIEHRNWALVTGASGGIGADFARGLAARGYNLLLVARREPELILLRDELTSHFGVEALAVAMDLAQTDAALKLSTFVHDQGLEVEVLVNNAGFGLYGAFKDLPWERQQALINLNISTLTGLTWYLLPAMLNRKRGRILLVSSVAAFQGCPNYAVYGASKSYVLGLGEALNHEIRGSGVTCTSYCPGVTRTGFFDVAGQTQQTLTQRLTSMDSATCAEIGLRAMHRGKSSAAAGWMNALVAFLTRFTPRRFNTWAGDFITSA